MDYDSNYNKLLISQLNTIDIQRTFDNPEESEKSTVARFVWSLRELGYNLSGQAYESLTTHHIPDIEEQLSSVLVAVRELVGDTGAQPLFGNFPNYENWGNDELMFLNFIHYLTGGTVRFRPLDYPDASDAHKKAILEHKPQIEHTLDALGSADISHFQESFLFSPVIKSTADRELLDMFATIYPHNRAVELEESDKDRPVLKENLAYFASVDMKHNRSIDYLNSLFTAPIDVLRLAYNLMGKDLKVDTDPSLVRFKFSRPQIRTLLELLNGILNTRSVDLSNSMRRYSVEFKHLARALHPMTDAYKKKYRNVYTAYNALMNNQMRGDSKNRIIDELLNNRHHPNEDIDEMFAKFPSLLLRNIAGLINASNKTDGAYYVVLLRQSIQDVPFATLAQAYRRFANPDYQPVYLVRNGYTVDYKDVDKLDDSVRQEILALIEGAIAEKSGEPVANTLVYLDPELRSLAVPVNERLTSAQFTVLPRLSRIKIPDNVDKLRSFVYWKNGTTDWDVERIDIDSAIIAIGEGVDSLYNSWDTRLLSEGDLLVHSGDITSAKPNAVEYQDMDIPGLIKAGYEYVVLTATSYTGQRFSDIITSTAGIMAIDSREEMDELWTPTNVIANVDINNPSTHNIVLIVDLKNREVIWVNAKQNNAQGAGDSLRDNSEEELYTRLAKSTPLTVGKLAELYYGDILLSDDEFASLPENTGVEIKHFTQKDITNLGEVFPEVFK